MPETEPQTREVVDIEQLADELRVCIGFFVRRLRQAQAEGELTLPETTALARLDRGGPTTATTLAKLEQVSAQSMGATLAGLEARGFVNRAADPADGRQSLISVTEAGLHALWDRRNARTELIAEVLGDEFSRGEIRRLAAAVPLIERLAQKV